jgi:hypothetical protein
MTFVGIDNGVTGSIGLIYEDGTTVFLPTPVYKTRSYTKKTKYIHRIQWQELIDNIPLNSSVFLERPLFNSKVLISSASALRALEATLIVLEMLKICPTYIDSKEWQKEFISSSVIGHDNMKIASMNIGIELFPNHASKIRKHGDADGLLIAEYGRRKYGI